MRQLHTLTKSKKNQRSVYLYTYTLENIDVMVGCLPLFRVTLVLAGDSAKNLIYS